MKTMKLKDRVHLNKRQKDYMFVFLCLLYPIGLWAFFFFSVNVSSFVMAFQKIDAFGYKTFNGLNNFRQFISESLDGGQYLTYALVNSLKNWAICTFICIPLYILFSYYIFKKTKGSGIVQTISLLTSMIPGMVFTLVFQRFVNGALPAIMGEVFNIKDFPRLFSVDEYSYGLTLFYMIWMSFSTSLIVYPNAMRGISDEIIESAHLDGVDNIFFELWFIILPLIYPTFTTFFVTGLAGIFTNGPSLLTFYMYDAPMQSYHMGYYIMIQTLDNPLGEAGYPLISAGGLLITVIIAPLTWITKYLLEKFGPSED